MHLRNRLLYLKAIWLHCRFHKYILSLLFLPLMLTFFHFIFSYFFNWFCMEQTGYIVLDFWFLTTWGFDNSLIMFYQANMESIIRNRELTETRMMQVNVILSFTVSHGITSFINFLIMLLLWDSEMSGN